MTISIVLADANELIPRTPRDYIIYLAQLGIYDLRWSDGIWEEVTRNLVTKFGFSEERVKYLSRRLDLELPHHNIVVPPEIGLIASFSGADSKDEHVVAAALAAEADVLLTENTRDFPAAWLKDRGVDVLNLGELLTQTATDYPAEFVTAHSLVLASSKISERKILRNLRLVIGDEKMQQLLEIITQESIKENQAPAASYHLSFKSVGGSPSWEEEIARRSPPPHPLGPGMF